MIVMNKNKMINGNNAMQPEYESYEDYKKKRKIEVRTRHRNIKHKLRIMRNIAIVFIVGMVLIARYSIIYNMQNQLTTVQNNIDRLSRENDNLTVELVKYNNLEYIEENAIKKLHMIQPEKSTAVYADLNKPIIKQETNYKSNKKLSNIWNIFKQFKWR